MTVQQILSILSSQKEELETNDLASLVSRAVIKKTLTTVVEMNFVVFLLR